MEEIRIGKAVLTEDDLRHKVTVFEIDFELKIPTPMERNAIEMDISRRLGGLPRNTFSADHVLETTVRVTLDTIVQECSDPKFKVWETYDTQLLYKLYGEYQDFYGRFLKRIER